MTSIRRKFTFLQLLLIVQQLFLVSMAVDGKQQQKVAVDNKDGKIAGDKQNKREILTTRSVKSMAGWEPLPLTRGYPAGTAEIIRATPTLQLDGPNQLASSSSANQKPRQPPAQPISSGEKQSPRNIDDLAGTPQISALLRDSISNSLRELERQMTEQLKRQQQQQTAAATSNNGQSRYAGGNSPVGGYASPLTNSPARLSDYGDAVKYQVATPTTTQEQLNLPSNEGLGGYDISPAAPPTYDNPTDVRIVETEKVASGRLRQMVARQRHAIESRLREIVREELGNALGGPLSLDDVVVEDHPPADPPHVPPPHGEPHPPDHPPPPPHPEEPLTFSLNFDTGSPKKPNPHDDHPHHHDDDTHPYLHAHFSPGDFPASLSHSAKGVAWLKEEVGEKLSLLARATLQHALKFSRHYNPLTFIEKVKQLPPIEFHWKQVPTGGGKKHNHHGH